MSADNFLAVPYTDCYACIGVKTFETTTELRALHAAQKIEREHYFEYGYTFVGKHWLTKREMLTKCPCEIRRFITEG